jgi:hypothetical protein
VLFTVFWMSCCNVNVNSPALCKLSSELLIMSHATVRGYIVVTESAFSFWTCGIDMLTMVSRGHESATLLHTMMKLFRSSTMQNAFWQIVQFCVEMLPRN